MNLKPIVFNLFDNEHYANAICEALQYRSGKMQIHQFPDKEIMIRIESSVKNHSVIFVASTDKPDTKMASLFFSAETAKELGAKKVGLIAPYLAYMRQDKQFHKGEGITSKYFAKMISTHFDWLLTIDPHLHRWHSLKELYTIPTTVLHASLSIAQWIKENIPNPILIGPDQESLQWVAEIAAVVNAPFLLAKKQRYSDSSVKATIPQIESYSARTPVVIDDIISTGVTMIETINHLTLLGAQDIHCVGVHAIFANNAYNELLATQVRDVATCNTIRHVTNKIDLSNLIIDAISQMESLHAGKSIKD